jgi:hypothetical protein
MEKETEKEGVDQCERALRVTRPSTASMHSVWALVYGHQPPLHPQPSAVRERERKREREKERKREKERERDTRGKEAKRQRDAVTPHPVV